MAALNAGYATHRQDHFTRSGAVRSLRCACLTRCRRFGPSPCPTHYGGRLATMPSADVCPSTLDVAAERAARVPVGSRGNSGAFAPGLNPAPMATKAPLGFDGNPGPFGPARSSTPVAAQTQVRQISPDKNLNFPCTTAAFTLPPAPVGLRHLVLTRPGGKASMRVLSVGSHFCAQASSRHPLAGLPLPSASSYSPLRGHRYSYRGLSPHELTLMPGVRQSASPAPDCG